MKTEFVRFITDDGVELQGLYFEPSDETPKAGIIHVHGLAGNFYENRFIEVLASAYSQKGYAFLTFNNRGHDYISDILKREGNEWTSIRGGGAYEVFSDALHDIDTAIEFLKGRGVKNLCLQGHSSGANKVVYYQSKRQNDSVYSIVLMSPCDDVGLQKGAKADIYDELLNMAQEFIANGQGDNLMPDGAFFSYPISAKSYVDYFGPDSLHDVFSYSRPESEFSQLASIKQPIMALFGNNGEYVVGDIAETLDLLRNKAKRSSRIDTAIIDGAPHNYFGREQELAKTILAFLEEVFTV